ncbi:MAG: sulfurtransferase TusA [Cellvibrionaceae bacterium]|nr:sulfurtransferase TusA [Cellvibrionaceae bacterium]
MTHRVKKILNASGLYCPEPIMLLHQAIREVAAGELIQLIATDPSTQRDVPKFCQFLGHGLLEQGLAGDGEYCYVIQKKP